MIYGNRYLDAEMLANKNDRRELEIERRELARESQKRRSAVYKELKKIIEQYNRPDMKPRISALLKNHDVPEEDFRRFTAIQHKADNYRMIMAVVSGSTKAKSALSSIVFEIAKELQRELRYQDINATCDNRDGKDGYIYIDFPI